MSTATERWIILVALIVLSVLVVYASFLTGDIFLHLLLITPTAMLWVVYREASRRRRSDSSRADSSEGATSS